jgi:hypothetical protein
MKRRKTKANDKHRTIVRKLLKNLGSKTFLEKEKLVKIF